MTKQAGSRRNPTSAFLPIATAAFAIAIFIGDTITQLEIAVGVFYVAVVLLAARFCRARGVVVVAAGCVGLTLLSYVLTPHGPAPAAITNTLISIATIGLTTFLVLQSQSAEVRHREQANLLDLTHDAIFVRDMESVIKYWNRGAEELYGWTAEQAAGKVTHDLLKTVFPKPLDQIEAEVRGAGRWEGALVHTKKDGTTVVVESRWSLQRDDRGVPVAVLETNNDITERKRAEQELRNQAELLSLAHDAIIVRDPESRIMFWNPGAAKTYGWSAAEAIGRVTHNLLQTRFPVSLQALDAALQEQGEWEGELSHITRQGTAIVVASRQSLRRDEHGAPAAILEINRDVTEGKRAEEEIRKLNEELEQRVIERTRDLEAVNRELEAFAYSVSHDLRAPLRHTVGYAELLQKNASSILDEKSRRYTLMIMESAQRMGTLIDDLLAFARVGRAEIQKTMVNLDQVVKEALGEVRQETDGRNIAWKMSALPNVRGDRSLLRLAFVNLITNAIKFTRTRAQAEIEIGADAKQAEIVVFIRDNGVGFDMKYVNKLFGVFQRLHRTEEFEGTGIGLATVQRIIHRHGGSVWAEGVLDRGATFYLALPKS